MTDLGVSTTDSDRPKTHAAMRSYVGEAKNKSWSLRERMRLLGILKLQPVKSGGEGSAGVRGTGVGLAGPGLLLRGSSFGILSLRLGMPEVSGGKDAGWAGDSDAMARFCVM